HHIVLNLSMPGDHIGRAATAPASVDERIALVDVEASHFRRPFLATEDAGAVLLPIDDMSQRILDRPGILRLRPRHPAAPVCRLQPSDQPIESLILAPRPVGYVFPRMSHSRSLAGPADSLGEGLNAPVAMGAVAQ